MREEVLVGELGLAPPHVPEAQGVVGGSDHHHTDQECCLGPFPGPKQVEDQPEGRPGPDEAEHYWLSAEQVPEAAAAAPDLAACEEDGYEGGDEEAQEAGGAHGGVEGVVEGCQRDCQGLGEEGSCHGGGALEGGRRPVLHHGDGLKAREEHHAVEEPPTPDHAPATAPERGHAIGDHPFGPYPAEQEAVDQLEYKVWVHGACFLWLCCTKQGVVVANLGR